MTSDHTPDSYQAPSLREAERIYRHVLCENKNFHRDHVWGEPLPGSTGGYTVRYCPGVMVIVKPEEGIDA